MKSKLTLTVEERLIEKAKRQAKAQGTSVSDLVEKYFAIMDGESTGKQDNSVFTRSLRGVMADSEVTEDDYYRYLEEKHQ